MSLSDYFRVHFEFEDAGSNVAWNDHVDLETRL